MLYKQNWEGTKQRFDKWWKREGLILNTQKVKRQSPIENVANPGKFDSLETKYSDPNYVSNSNHYILSNYDYPADSIPMAYSDWGTVSLAAFLGCEQVFKEETVWYEPCLKSIEDNISFNPQNKYLIKMKDCLAKNNALAKNRYLVSGNGYSSGLDTLAALFPAQDLLMDMLTKPNTVIRRLDEIHTAYEQLLDGMWDYYIDEYGGSTFPFFDIWGHGKTTQLQCDFAAMLSPKMMADFVIPYTEKQCELYDNTLFHVDGTQCLPIVNQLIELDNLDAIEWTPQAGIEQGGNERWYDLYKKILDSGKSVQIIGVKPNEVMPIVKKLGKQGVYIFLDSNNLSFEEANELYKRVKDF
jgi:hypothetical protein